MKIIDDVMYLTIGEVAKRVDRIPQTLKNWLEWHKDQPDDIREKFDLPVPITDIDAKGTRYFREEDVDRFIRFRDDLIQNKGMIADVSIRRWGRRGEEIKKRKELADE